MTAGRRLQRGDTVNMQTVPDQLGTVLRVARDEAWVDVGWWRQDGYYGWTKRQLRYDLVHMVCRPWSWR